MKSLIATLFVLALAACNPTTTTAPPADAGPQITAAIEAQETAMNTAVAAKNAATVAGFYAPDAQMFNPGMDPATTPEAILGAYQGLLADPNGSLSFHGEEVINPSSGDYAVSHGTFAISFTDPVSHQRVEQSGNYVTLWRYQDENSWKIIRDIATPGAPPAGEH